MPGPEEAQREILSALRANTLALGELRAEVSRLADTFGKVLQAEPRRTPEAAGGTLAGELVGGVLSGLLRGPGKKKR